MMKWAFDGVGGVALVALLGWLSKFLYGELRRRHEQREHTGPVQPGTEPPLRALVDGDVDGSSFNDIELGEGVQNLVHGNVKRTNIRNVRQR